MRCDEMEARPKVGGLEEKKGESKEWKDWKVNTILLQHEVENMDG